MLDDNRRGISRMGVPAEGEADLRLIGLVLGEECFAIDITDVHEINRFEQINRIPDLPEHVLGIIDLRGSVIPVINLAEMLGIRSREVTKDTRIIVVEIQGGKMGVLVDSVTEVLRTDRSSLERPPSVIKRVNVEYIKGIIRNNKQLVVVLDLNKLFKKINLSSVIKHQDISIEHNNGSLTEDTSIQEVILHMRTILESHEVLDRHFDSMTYSADLPGSFDELKEIIRNNKEILSHIIKGLSLNKLADQKIKSVKNCQGNRESI